MHKILACGALVVSLAGGTSLAHGPSGSYEGDSRHRVRNNNVRCSQGITVPRTGAKIYATSRGVEFCNDRGAIPVQGRFIVDRHRQYVAADGDRNNRAPLTGYARVDRTGPHCSRGSDQDSAHSRTAGNPRSCDAR